MKNSRKTPIQTAVDSERGQQLLVLLREDFKNALDLNPSLRDSMDRVPTYLGSEKHFEHLIYKILAVFEPRGEK